MTIVDRENSNDNQIATQDDIAALLLAALERLKIQDRRINTLEAEVTTLQEESLSIRAERAVGRRTRKRGPLRVGDKVKVVVTHRLRGGQVGEIQKVTAAQFKVYDSSKKETFHIYKHNVIRYEDFEEYE